MISRAEEGDLVFDATALSLPGVTHQTQRKERRVVT